MPKPYAGAIDCDVHPHVASIASLSRYMSDYWRDTVALRGIESFETIAYPAKSPLTIRPELRTGAERADASAKGLAKALLDPRGVELAILNCLYAVQTIRDDNLALAFSRAVNDWVRAEWLDRDPRLRASIVVPQGCPELAVEEIERIAPDQRFVQVLFVAGGEHPLGKRMFWPVHAAAERHGLVIAIHAGSTYHHAVTGSGWPSYYLEDYAAQAAIFHAQLGSLIAEGVFVKFPKLKAVLVESGVTWLPAYLWRLSKFWRGVRNEVPWIDRPPIEIVRDHIRLTAQPFDGPSDAASVQRIMDLIGSDDLLLFASDFPHWHDDGGDLLPAGLTPALRRKIMIDNPRATYPRLAANGGGADAAP
ncbi:MAG TPA: amidohydrolase family protein [Hyphomicrobiaceae bacterium]|nr:amidohydrolase family protein [Hyphomicrobiaceae bacterium]